MPASNQSQAYRPVFKISCSCRFGTTSIGEDDLTIRISILKILKFPSMQHRLSQLITSFNILLRTYWMIAIDIAQGLVHIHKNKIIHQDIKPSNILLDHFCCAVIADFDIAIELTDKTPWIGGTSGFASPEKDRKPSRDIFSYGMVLWAITSKQECLFPEVI